MKPFLTNRLFLYLLKTYTTWKYFHVVLKETSSMKWFRACCNFNFFEKINCLNLAKLLMMVHKSNNISSKWLCNGTMFLIKLHYSLPHSTKFIGKLQLHLQNRTIHSEQKVWTPPMAILPSYIFSEPPVFGKTFSTISP